MGWTVRTIYTLASAKTTLDTGKQGRYTQVYSYIVRIERGYLARELSYCKSHANKILEVTHG